MSVPIYYTSKSPVHSCSVHPHFTGLSLSIAGSKS